MPKVEVSQSKSHNYEKSRRARPVAAVNNYITCHTHVDNKDTLTGSLKIKLLRALSSSFKLPTHLNQAA